MAELRAVLWERNVKASWEVEVVGASRTSHDAKGQFFCSVSLQMIIPATPLHAGESDERPG